MVSERRLAGMHRGQVQKTSIDLACLAWLQMIVDHLPGAPEDRPRIQLVAKDRPAERLRLAHQGTDQMA